MASHHQLDGKWEFTETDNAHLQAAVGKYTMINQFSGLFQSLMACRLATGACWESADANLDLYPQKGRTAPRHSSDSKIPRYQDSKKSRDFFWLDAQILRYFAGVSPSLCDGCRRRKKLQTTPPPRVFPGFEWELSFMLVTDFVTASLCCTNKDQSDLGPDLRAFL